MIEVFQSLVPEEYKTTKKLFMHYLNTLPDKVYKVKNSDLSDFEIQISKFKNEFTIVNHKHYKTEVSKICLSKIEFLLKEQTENDINTHELFLLDLRF